MIDPSRQPLENNEFTQDGNPFFSPDMYDKSSMRIREEIIRLVLEKRLETDKSKKDKLRSDINKLISRQYITYAEKNELPSRVIPPEQLKKIVQLLEQTDNYDVHNQELFQFNVLFFNDESKLMINVFKQTTQDTLQQKLFLMPEIHPLSLPSKRVQQILALTKFGMVPEISVIDVPLSDSITVGKRIDFSIFVPKSKNIIEKLKESIYQGKTLFSIITDPLKAFSKSSISECFGLLAYHLTFVRYVKNCMALCNELDTKLAEKVSKSKRRSKIELIRERNIECTREIQLLEKLLEAITSKMLETLTYISNYKKKSDSSVENIKKVFRNIEEQVKIDLQKEELVPSDTMKDDTVGRRISENLQAAETQQRLLDEEKREQIIESEDKNWSSIIEAFEQYQPTDEIRQVDLQRKSALPEQPEVELDTRFAQPGLPEYFKKIVRKNPSPPIDAPITRESLSAYVLRRFDIYLQYRQASQRQVIDTNGHWAERNKSSITRFMIYPPLLYSDQEIRMSDIANIWYTYGFGNVQRHRYENYFLGCSSLTTDRVNRQFHIHLFRWNDSPEGRGRDEQGTALLKCSIPGQNTVYHVLLLNIIGRYRRRDAYDIAEYLYFLSIGILQLSGSCHDIANVVRAPETTLRYYKDGTLEPFSGKKQRNRYLAYL